MFATVLCRLSDPSLGWFASANRHEVALHEMSLEREEGVDDKNAQGSALLWGVAGGRAQVLAAPIVAEDAEQGG